MPNSQHTNGATLLEVSTGSWLLDPAATTVELHTKAMWGMAKVKGRFATLRGGGTVGVDGAVSGSLVIDATSVDTGQKKRDAHLLTADFFDVAKYPTFEYTVTSAQVSSDGAAIISGTFTAHGQTHPLEVRGQVALTADDRLQISGEADLDRSQWGIGWTKMGARLDNHITVSATFTR